MSLKIASTFAPRISNRVLAKSPTKGNILHTNKWTLFLAENYGKMGKKSGGLSSNIKQLREKYSKLTPSAMEQYKKQAEGNRNEVQKRMSVLKQAMARPFNMFMKENYAKVVKGVKGDGFDKSQNVLRQ